MKKSDGANMKYEIRVDRYKANLKSMKLDKLIKSSTMRYF